MAAATDFSIFAGDDVAQVLTAKDGAGAVIDLTSCQEITFTAQRSLDAGVAPTITKTKTGGGITVDGTPTDGKLTVIMSAVDTGPLTLGYFFFVTVRNAAGKTTTGVTGRMAVGLKPVSTYSGDPGTSARDYARFLVGDTDMDNPIVTDSGYDALLANFGGPLYVAAQICRQQAQRYAGRATKRTGDFSISNGDVSRNYLAMADQYQAQADMGIGAGAVYAGGISRSDMAQYRKDENSDNVGAFTTLKAFDNHGSWGGFAPDNLGGE